MWERKGGKGSKQWWKRFESGDLRTLWDISIYSTSLIINSERTRKIKKEHTKSRRLSYISEIQTENEGAN